MQDTLDAYRLLIADVYELAGLSRRTSDKLARPAGHSVARWHALSVLSDGPRTVPSAARRLGLARQSLQRVVDDLVTAGLVAARPNPDHARAPLYELTPEGRDVLESLFRDSDQSRLRLLAGAGVTTAELESARKVIRLLVAALRAGSKPGAARS